MGRWSLKKHLQSVPGICANSRGPAVQNGGPEACLFVGPIPKRVVGINLKTQHLHLRISERACCKLAHDLDRYCDSVAMSFHQQMAQLSDLAAVSNAESTETDQPV